MMPCTWAPDCPSEATNRMERFTSPDKPSDVELVCNDHIARAQTAGYALTDPPTP